MVTAAAQGVIATGDVIAIGSGGDGEPAAHGSLVGCGFRLAGHRLFREQVFRELVCFSREH